jgi:hypothetical protein
VWRFQIITKAKAKHGTLQRSHTPEGVEIAAHLSFVPHGFRTQVASGGNFAEVAGKRHGEEQAGALKINVRAVAESGNATSLLARG